MHSQHLLLCLATYCLGSLSPSYLFTKWLKNQDLRDLGSGNLGATNTMRILGWRVGLVVLLLDLSKGLTAVLLVNLIFSDAPLSARCAAGFAAILGHVFPIFLNFKGGKGVATTAGVLLALDPMILLTSLAAFGLCFAVTRIVSLSSLIAAAVLGTANIFAKGPSEAFNNELAKTLCFLVISALVFWSHRDNIRRLFLRQEAPLNPASTSDSKSDSKTVELSATQNQNEENPTGY